MGAELRLWAGKGEPEEKRTQDWSSGISSLIGKTQTDVQGVQVLCIGVNEQLYLKQAQSLRSDGDTWLLLEQMLSLTAT